MNKLIIALTCFALVSVASLAAFDGSYDIPCPACKEKFKETNTGCIGCHAWRMYELDNPKEGKYLHYNCEHGHELLVPSDPNDNDISHIKVKDYKNLHGEYRNIDTSKFSN